jgi:amidophosphoribosyltransferase
MKSFEILTKIRFSDDKPHDHCAVFGIYGHPQAAQISYYGLYAQQHRGQEASGIVTSYYDPEDSKYHFHVHKDFGLVNDVFKGDALLMDYLVGCAAIGHNRYSTAGASNNKHNIQPLTVNYKDGNIAIAHNGTLTNFHILRKKLQDEGTIFQTTSDTEIILHLMARSAEKDPIKQILDALRQVEGAYSLTVLLNDKLIAARDPHGWRPLAVGKLGEAFVVASETCAFDIINAEYISDVAPGELLVFDMETMNTGEVKSFRIKSEKTQPHHCIFEYIYFSRPDSKIFGENVDKVRRKLGKSLAQEHPVPPNDATESVVVINVPDSSNTATLGFVSQSNKMGNKAKYEIGLIRSHYVGRTFILPMQDVRELKVRTKFNTVKGVLNGKKVVIIDDSIVRGTTSKQLVKLVRNAGAREIHFRVTAPPIRYPCHYGMDFPTEDELIANWCSGEVEKIRQELQVDSLGYISLEKLLESAPHEHGESYCTACFSGKYPTPVENGKTKLENEM